MKTVSEETQKIFNRQAYLDMVAKAKRELARARKAGFSDQEILESLRSGSEAQKNYADFIEFNLLKVG